MMMKVGTLLDTHAWLWMVGNERQRANPTAWEEIDRATLTNSLGVSEISFWEIAVKAASGRLELTKDPVVWLREAAATPGIGIMEVTRETLVKSALLEMEHRDPADRILVATAIRYGMRLATADARILRYAKKNPLLRTLDMRPPVAKLTALPERAAADAHLSDLLRSGAMRLGSGKLPRDFFNPENMAQDPTGAVLQALLDERGEGR